MPGLSLTWLGRDSQTLFGQSRPAAASNTWPRERGGAERARRQPVMLREPAGEIRRALEPGQGGSLLHQQRPPQRARASTQPPLGQQRPGRLSEPVLEEAPISSMQDQACEAEAEQKQAGGLKISCADPAPNEAVRGVDMIRQWRIMLCVEFIETPTFTRLIGKLMDDDEYAKMQLALVLRPDWGKVIPGSGGLRKLRWAGSGRGKRGGSAGHLLLAEC